MYNHRIILRGHTFKVSDNKHARVNELMYGYTIDYCVHARTLSLFLSGREKYKNSTAYRGIKRRTLGYSRRDRKRADYIRSVTKVKFTLEEGRIQRGIGWGDFSGKIISPV